MCSPFKFVVIKIIVHIRLSKCLILCTGINPKKYFSKNNNRLSRTCITHLVYIGNEQNNNCLWQPCQLVNWYKMRKICREPPISQPYKVTIHWALYFQRRKLKKLQPIRYKNFHGGPNERTFYRTFHKCFLFQLIWSNGFREDFFNWPITNKN